MPKLKDDAKKLESADIFLIKAKGILINQEADQAHDACEWAYHKAELHYNREDKDNLHIFNNYIYWAYLGINVGSEQNKARPVLVVRSIKEWNTCIIIPLTTQKLSDGIPYHVDLEDSNSTALIEQIRTISKKRIYKAHYKKQKNATITQNDWNKINQQLTNLCLLKPIFTKNK